MEATIFRLRARIWRAITRHIPTCYLQWELAGRPGVMSRVVPLGETATVSGVGPCTLTVNSD